MVLEQYIQNDYMRAIIIGIVLLTLIRIIIAISFKVLSKFTAKTETTLDDLIFQKTATPATIIIFLLIIEIPLYELPFGADMFAIISKIVLSGVVLTLGYLAYTLFDIIIVGSWQRFAKKTRTKIDANLASLIHGILRTTMLILAFLYILNLWGIEIGPLLAGLGIAGLAVALALQPTLSNIFSGVSMILDKTLRVGDLVYLDTNAKGKVEKIGLRSTKIRTFDNEFLIIPNNKLAESQIQNVSLPEPKSRVVIPFGVAYGSDIEKVKSLILKEIKSIDKAVDDPETMVRFIEMSDSSLNFKAYFFVASHEDRFASIDEANTKIYNALNKAGITIPFPQMDVHFFNDEKNMKK